MANTKNLGIQLLTAGGHTGAWGDLTNKHFEMLDEAHGILVESLTTKGTTLAPNTLPITDGAESKGRHLLIEIDDVGTGDLGGTAYVQITPDDAEKILIVRNSLTASRDIDIFQGVYATGTPFTLPAGKDAILRFDGGGAAAAATNVFEDLYVGAATTGGVTTTGADVASSQWGQTLDATNNAITTLTMTHATTVSPIAGIGVGMDFIAETTDGNETGAQIHAVTTNVGSGTEEFDLVVKLMTGGTLAEAARLVSTGQFNLAATEYQIGGTSVLSGTTLGANVVNSSLTNLGVLTTLDVTSGTVDFTGATVTDLGTVTTAVISGGSLNGTPVGATSHNTGKFTTLEATSTSTLTGAVTFGAEIIETVYTGISGANPAIDPANGTVQVWTLSQVGHVPTFNIADGESVKLTIPGDSSYTVTWTNVDQWMGGVAQTMHTTDESHVELWKEGTTLYGAFLGYSS